MFALNQSPKTLLLSLLGASCSYSWLIESHADSNSNSSLDTVIVTTSSEKSIVRIPYDLKILDKTNAQRKQARTLPETLRVLPGVQVQKTANGHGSPFLRGFTGNRTLALIDGIRFNNSTYRDGANEYFSHIDVNSIETIEVLYGAASTLFGSEAIGGTINLQTKSALKHASGFYLTPSASLRLATGENSYAYRFSSHMGHADEWGLIVGITDKSYGDLRAAKVGALPRTGYEEISADLRFDFQLTDDWNFTGVHQSFSQNDVWRTHSTIFNIPYAGSQSGYDLVRSKDQERSLSYIRLSTEQSYPFFDAASFTLSYQPRKDTERRVRNNNLKINQGFTSDTQGADVKLHKAIKIGQLSYGISHYVDDIESWRHDIFPDFSTTQRIQGPVGDDASYSQFGAFSQLETQLTDQLTLFLGGRYSHLNAKIGRFEDPTSGQLSSLSQNWNNLSFGVRSSFALSQQKNQFIWASLSESFRAPNIADLTRFGQSRSSEFEIASPDLDPEKFLTLELGWKLSTDKSKADLTWYYTDIKDYIQTAPTGRIAEGLTEVSKQNLANGYVQGVDASLTYSLNPSLDAHISASWLEAELSLPDQPYSYEPFSRMMPPSARFGIDWQPENIPFKLGSDIRIVTHANRLSSGDKSDTQRIPPDGTPSYTLWDAYAYYDLSEKIKLNVTLENITNQAYRVHGSGSNEVGFNVIFSLNISR